MMTLQDILRAKGHEVHTISSQTSLEEVVQTLVRHNCGSLVVFDAQDPASQRMVGIVTERDILKACARSKTPLSEIPLASVMTTDVLVGLPTDSVEEAMGLMTEMRIRHLPVLEDGQICGIISIGDVVKIQHDRLTMENHYLKSYLHG